MRPVSLPLLWGGRASRAVAIHTGTAAAPSPPMRWVEAGPVRAASQTLGSAASQARRYRRLTGARPGSRGAAERRVDCGDFAQNTGGGLPRNVSLRCGRSKHVPQFALSVWSPRRRSTPARASQAPCVQLAMAVAVQAQRPAHKNDTLGGVATPLLLDADVHAVLFIKQHNAEDKDSALWQQARTRLRNSRSLCVE